MKTQNKILTDFWKIISATPISDLDGGIYKKTRPTDSKLNDCVISLIAGKNAKFIQDAALYVKIFYADIFQSNTYFEDSAKGETIENLLIDLSGILLKNKDYSFDIQSRDTYTEKVLDPAINEHYAILKINFKTLIK